MKWLERPVILIGHGCRAAGADAAALLEIGVPVLSSWQACDLVDNHHPMYYGRPGVFGQRCANHILHSADQVLALGNRMAIWNVGYEGIRPDQELWQCDVDEREYARHAHVKRIQQDLKKFAWAVSGDRVQRPEWIAQCNAWRDAHPWLESPTHDHGKYLNSYRVIHRIGETLKPDSVIVTEMGLALGAFQVLKLKPPQRLITSGGLGEMGCGMPMAVGASFARNKGEVILLATDGGMMLNLQELQTIVHHDLPIRIWVFGNDGYGMLKGTHRNMGTPYTGVDRMSGVSCPDFQKLAFAFGIQAANVRTVDDLERVIVQMENAQGPALCVVHCDPEQPQHPKLEPVNEGGNLRSPAFNEMSPR